MRRLTGLLAAAVLTLPAWASAQTSPTAPAHPVVDPAKPKAEAAKPAAKAASAVAKKADEKHPTQPVHPVIDTAKKPAAKPEKTG